MKISTPEIFLPNIWKLGKLGIPNEKLMNAAKSRDSLRLNQQGGVKLPAPRPARPHRIRVKEIKTSGCVKQLRVMKQK